MCPDGEAAGRLPRVGVWEHRTGKVPESSQAERCGPGQTWDALWLQHQCAVHPGVVTRSSEPLVSHN